MQRIAVAIVLAILPLAAHAETEGVLATRRPITWGMIFALCFLMLGPIKLLSLFAEATKDCDRRFRFNLATRAFLFSVAAVTIAAGLGKRILDGFAISVQVLQITAGVILFLVALQSVMQQYRAAPDSERDEPPTLAMAFSPLAFPTIVTPYGIAAVTILVTLAPSDEIGLKIAGVVYSVLVLDWLAMLAAHAIVRRLGPILLLFGVVLGVTQVALGLQVTLGGITGLIEQGAFAIPSR